MDGHPFVMEEKESTTAKAAMELENEEFGYCTEFIPVSYTHLALPISVNNDCFVVCCSRL